MTRRSLRRGRALHQLTGLAIVRISACKRSARHRLLQEQLSDGAEREAPPASESSSYDHLVLEGLLYYESKFVRFWRRGAPFADRSISSSAVCSDRDR